MRLLLCILIAAMATGCAGLVMEYTPMSTEDGSQAYAIRTVYGLVDGNKEQAVRAVDREATRLCDGDYNLVSEEEHPRETNWGARNGQIDLVWQVSCVDEASDN